MSCVGSASAKPSACASFSAAPHPRQDVVAGAVEDAGHLDEAIAGEPALDGANHRNAASHRPFEPELAAV